MARRFSSKGSWLPALPETVRCRLATRRRSRFSLFRQLRVEPLEDRRLLAILVDTLADEADGSIVDGDISLRDAIALAPAGETIEFASGLTSGGPAAINLTLGELVISKNLTINGPGADLLTIDASGSDPTPDQNNGDGNRVLYISDGTTAVRTVLISGLTLTGGDTSTSGGAIHSLENLTVTLSTITGNSARNGGGIQSTVSLSVDDSTISGNTAVYYGSGGGISAAGNLTVAGSTISDNTAAGSGGGIYRNYGSGNVIISSSTISGNSARFNGGGIFRGYGSGNLNISTSTISANTTQYGSGGGISTSGTLNVTGTTISDNSAAVSGGGIYRNYGSGNVGINSSTITANSAQEGGGVFVTGTANVTFNGSTVSGNTATYNGGGIWRGYGNLTVTASTVSGNSTTIGFGGGIYGRGYGNHSIVRSTINDNSAGGGSGGGVARRFGNLSVNLSIVSGNSAVSGGGIDNRYGNLTVTASAVRYNSAATGGGVYSRYGNLTVNGSTLSGNMATAGSGGGIWRRGYNEAVTVSNSTINGNISSGNGGGLYLFGTGATDIAVRHSTITSNSAGGFGGGITAVGGTLDLNHTILAQNFAHFAPDLTNLFGTINARFSLIGDHSGSTLSATPSGTPDRDGNLIGPALLREPLMVYVEMAAMGDFESGPNGDSFLFEYSMDGAPFQPLFTTSVDAAGSQTYFMDSGIQVVLDDPLVVDGVALNKYFQGFTTLIPDPGAEIRVRFTATSDSSEKAFAWRNLSIYGANSGQFVGAAVQFGAFSDVFAAFSADSDYTIAGDMFGIRSRTNTGVPNLPSDIADDSISISPGDVQGIISQFDTGRFFGVVDTVNGVRSDTNSATWTFHNALAPIDPRLANFAENGGPLLPDGSRLFSYPLLSDSPALDAGDPVVRAGVGGVPAFDQRGTAPFGRLADGDEDGDTRIDIGAVEQRTLHLIVDTLVDEDDGNLSRNDLSLREAIGLANRNFGPDVIEFAPALAGGTILLEMGELSVTDSVSLVGLGVEVLTIDASGNDPTPEENNGDGSRVFAISSPYGATNVHIQGLTITGGDSLFGGGILNFANLSLSDSSITGNAAADRGGGIDHRYGSLTITATTISGNSSGDRGGGIYSRYGNLTVTGSTISGNTSGGGGGGIRTRSGSLTVSASAITANTTSGEFAAGGGILSEFGVLRVTGSVISGNTAIRKGGGIYSRFNTTSVTGTAVRDNLAHGGGGMAVEYSAVVITDSTISFNYSRGFGGGVSISTNYAESTLLNSTVSGNTAAFGGGGIYLSSTGPAVLWSRHSTIAENSARFGGGVFAAVGTATLDHTIVTQNFANVVGPDITGVVGFDIDARYSLIGDSTGSGLTATPSKLPDANGNIIGPAPTEEDLIVYVEMAAMGDFEAGPDGDRFLFEYSVDGGPFQPLFTVDVNEQANQTYFMDRGTQVLLEDPLVVQGVPLNKYFQGFSAVVPDPGAEIRIRFTASSDGPNEAFAWRNLYIHTQNSSQVVGAAVQYEELYDVIAEYTADADYAIQGDMFGIRSRPNPGTAGLPPEVDDNSNSDVRDRLGIISQFDFGRFFGVVDTVNEVGSDTNSATWTFHNIREPIGAKLSSLADNAGPLLPDGRHLQSHALLFGSPALDAGDPSAVAGVGGVPTLDQRGEPFARVSDGDDDGVVRIDMGALEQAPIVIVVDTLLDESDGDYSAGDLSLREAIHLANESLGGIDNITFAPTLAGGTIELIQGALAIVDSVRVIGLGDELLTVDASGSDPTPTSNNGDGSSVFEIVSNAANVEIRGLTISGGDSYTGGGIFNAGNLLLTDSTVTGNTSGYGGGIYSSFGSSLVIDRSTLSDNRARYGGGAVQIRYGTLTVSGSSIQGNSATGGGGIYSAGYSSRISISSSTISGNSSTAWHGGGVYAREGQLTVSDSTFSGNSTVASGGGIAKSFGTATITGSTFSANTAGEFGGGIYSSSYASFSFQHSTIIGNRANTNGGGISSTSRLMLNHTIVAGNSTRNRDGNDLSGSAVLAFSLLGVDRGATVTDNGGNLIGTASVPVNPQLGPLADNGGPTRTHAPLLGSPVIDAGDSAAEAGVDDIPLFDQRGESYLRVRDGDGTGGVRIDIGAVELELMPLTAQGDYNQNGWVDAADYVVWRNTKGMNVAPFTGADGNGDGVIDDLDREIWKAHFGMVLPALGMGSLGVAAPTMFAHPSVTSKIRTTPAGPVALGVEQVNLESQEIIRATNAIERDIALAGLDLRAPQFVPPAEGHLRRRPTVINAESGANTRWGEMMIARVAIPKTEQSLSESGLNSRLREPQTEDATQAVRSVTLDVAFAELERAARP